MRESNPTAVERLKARIAELAPRERTFWREAMASRPSLTKGLVTGLRSRADGEVGAVLQSQAMRTCTEAFKMLPLTAQRAVIADIPIHHTPEEIVRYELQREKQSPAASANHQRSKRRAPTPREAIFLKFMRQGLRGDMFYRAIVAAGVRHPDGWRGDPHWKAAISKERYRIQRKFPELAKTPREFDGEQIALKRTGPA